MTREAAAAAAAEVEVAVEGEGTTRPRHRGCVGAAATVSAAFLYTDFKDASGNLTEVEAHFPNGKSTVTLSALRSMAGERIDKRCVRL